MLIIDRHAHLKYRYGNSKFGCTGFYVGIVGRIKKVIENYIRNQLQEDIVAKQLTLVEYIDPLFLTSKFSRYIHTIIPNDIALR